MGYLGKEHRGVGAKAHWSGGSGTVVEFAEALHR
jgi:hypothetical protein